MGSYRRRRRRRSNESDARDGFKGQSIYWVGRTVAALLGDRNIDKKAGKVVWCFDIADEFDIREEDGSVAPSHRSLRFLGEMAGRPNNWPTWIKIPKFLYTW